MSRTRCFGFAALLAVPVAVGLAVLASACGAIHGSPACGPLSMAAVPIVVLSLLAEQLLFGTPQGEGTLRVLLGVTAYAIALLLVLLGVWLRALAARR